MAYWVFCSGSHQSAIQASVKLHSLLEFGSSSRLTGLLAESGSLSLYVDVSVFLLAVSGDHSQQPEATDKSLS